MGSNSLIPALIGHNMCLAALSRKNGLKLAKNDLFLLSMVLHYNEIGVNCGTKHLEVFCAANGFTRGRDLLSLDISKLAGAGLVVSRKSKAWYSLLNLHVTIQGKQVLNDFERLLSNYKVKGLPVV